MEPGNQRGSVGLDLRLPTVRWARWGLFEFCRPWARRSRITLRTDGGISAELASTDAAALRALKRESPSKNEMEKWRFLLMNRLCRDGEQEHNVEQVGNMNLAQLRWLGDLDCLDGNNKSEGNAMRGDAREARVVGLRFTVRREFIKSDHGFEVRRV
jgi:hypothetical protein